MRLLDRYLGGHVRWGPLTVFGCNNLQRFPCPMIANAANRTDVDAVQASRDRVRLRRRTDGRDLLLGQRCRSAALNIDRRRDSFQMLWVHAGWCLAKMVNLITVGDGSLETRVGKTVRKVAVVTATKSVATREAPSLPDPAGGCEGAGLFLVDKANLLTASGMTMAKAFSWCHRPAAAASTRGWLRGYTVHVGSAPNTSGHAPGRFALSREHTLIVAEMGSAS